MNPLSLLNKGQTINGFKSRAVSYKLPSGSFVPNFSNTKPAPPTSSPTPQAAQAPREITQPTFFDIPRPAVPAPRPTAPTPKPPAAPPAPAPREPMWNKVVAFCRDLFEKWTDRTRCLAIPKAHRSNRVGVGENHGCSKRFVRGGRGSGPRSQKREARKSRKPNSGWRRDRA